MNQVIKKGLHWTPATGGFFIPFEDGTSILIPEEDDASRNKEIQNFASEKDAIGYAKMMEFFDRYVCFLSTEVNYT